MKNCVTDESSASKINADIDNRIETGKFSLFDHKMLKTGYFNFYGQYWVG